MINPNIEMITAIRDLTFACKSLETAIGQMLLIQKNMINNQADNVKDQPKNDDLSNYVPIRELIKQYSQFSESSIRSLIFFEHQNNFGHCYRRIGRKIMISKRDFALWINANGGVVKTNWSAEFDRDHPEWIEATKKNGKSNSDKLHY